MNRWLCGLPEPLRAALLIGFLVVTTLVVPLAVELWLP